MSVYSDKSNVIHFRPKNIQRLEFVFTCGSLNILYSDKYIYLNIMITEYIDYDVTAKYVSRKVLVVPWDFLLQNFKKWWFAL